MIRTCNRRLSVNPVGARYRENVVADGVSGECDSTRSRILPFTSSFSLSMGNRRILIANTWRRVSIQDSLNEAGGLSLTVPVLFPVLLLGKFRLIANGRMYAISIGSGTMIFKDRCHGSVAHEGVVAPFLFDCRAASPREGLELMDPGMFPENDRMLLTAVCLWLKAISHTL